jgi:hypothetical protein
LVVLSTSPRPTLSNSVKESNSDFAFLYYFINLAKPEFLLKSYFYFFKPSSNSETTLSMPDNEAFISVLIYIVYFEVPIFTPHKQKSVLAHKS